MVCKNRPCFFAHITQTLFLVGFADEKKVWKLYSQASSLKIKLLDRSNDAPQFESSKLNPLVGSWNMLSHYAAIFSSVKYLFAMATP
jgi:hypothetical protein